MFAVVARRCSLVFVVVCFVGFDCCIVVVMYCCWYVYCCRCVLSVVCLLMFIVVVYCLLLALYVARCFVCCWLLLFKWLSFGSVFGGGCYVLLSVVWCWCVLLIVVA